MTKHLSNPVALYILLIISTQAYTPIVIKNITALGPQLTPDVSNVSRDGGYSALIDGNIVWLYDDTECMNMGGHKQLSFVSNTASYSYRPTEYVTTVSDFGVVDLGKEQDGTPKNAILADTTVGTGGWIPFQPDELHFNHQMQGEERVAICEQSEMGNGDDPGIDGDSRARKLPDCDQHHAGLFVCTIGLRGHETARPVQRVSRPRIDSDNDHGASLWTCSDSSRRPHHSGDTGRFWRVFYFDWSQEYRSCNRQGCGRP